MQYGPYDAYMEVPYKNVDKDTKLDLPYSYDSTKEKDRRKQKKEPKKM